MMKKVESKEATAAEEEFAVLTVPVPARVATHDTARSCETVTITRGVNPGDYERFFGPLERAPSGLAGRGWRFQGEPPVNSRESEENLQRFSTRRGRGTKYSRPERVSSDGSGWCVRPATVRSLTTGRGAGRTPSAQPPVFGLLRRRVRRGKAGCPTPCGCTPSS